MYELTVELDFDAAHALRGYQGKCEKLHGHRFRVLAHVNANQLNDIGLGFDFTELKRLLGEVLTRFDHTHLNEVAPFDRINPSSENIASTIYDELRQKLPGCAASLQSIEVWESPDAGVKYRPLFQPL